MSKLKKKRNEFQKLIDSRTYRYDSQDKILVDVADCVSSSMYLILKDEYDFGAKKLLNFYQRIKEVRSGDIGDVELFIIDYCNEKGLQIYKRVKSISTTKKTYILKQYGYKGSVADAVKYFDRYMIATLGIGLIALKKYYKFSYEKLNHLMDRVTECIVCMTTMQPRSKKPYLTKKMINEAFLDELRLDIEKGVIV